MMKKRREADVSPADSLTFAGFMTWGVWHISAVEADILDVRCCEKRRWSKSSSDVQQGSLKTKDVIVVPSVGVLYISPGDLSQMRSSCGGTLLRLGIGSSCRCGVTCLLSNSTPLSTVS